ncbi:MAG TPA: hypothetical protein VFI24_15030 [Pyrinomonadaceae bacterium]|nr:hypothetical protein [Pyrinomonadaceae bacterium]
MTNEEFERTTEFLLNQQAKFFAGMQELKEAQAITEQKVAEAAAVAKRAGEVAEVALEGVSRLTDVADQMITTMTAIVRATYERMNQGDEKINALIHSQMLTEESLKETAKEQRETAKELRETAKRQQETDKQMQETDRRLRNLTDLFERHIREDHRGRNGSQN